MRGGLHACQLRIHRMKGACRFKSIPAFTANLTMEMFQKQTVEVQF